MDGEKTLVDKTNVLTLISTLSGVLRESCSITSPIITIDWTNNSQISAIPNFNYVYIPAFNRYYFVTDITCVRNNLWNISLKVDVLMSFKTEILSQTCVVARNEFEFIPTLKDDNRPILPEYEYEIVELRNVRPFIDTLIDSNVDYIVQVTKGE